MFLSKIVLAALILRWAGNDVEFAETLKGEISAGMFAPTDGFKGSSVLSSNLRSKSSAPSGVVISTASGMYMLIPEPCPLLSRSYETRHYHHYFFVQPFPPRGKGRLKLLELYPQVRLGPPRYHRSGREEVEVIGMPRIMMNPFLNDSALNWAAPLHAP